MRSALIANLGLSSVLDWRLCPRPVCSELWAVTVGDGAGGMAPPRSILVDSSQSRSEGGAARTRVLRYHDRPISDAWIATRTARATVTAGP